MVLDQNTTPAAPETAAAPVSGIENEFPTYRAISPMAVISLVLGVLSLLSFTDWAFLIFAAAAVILGLLADRKIRRYPEVLTGRGLARGGIALGLVFGLAALTTGSVQELLRRRAAESFARSYANILKTGRIEDAVWYTKPPVIRDRYSPTELYKEIQAHQAQAGIPVLLDMQTGDLVDLKKRLSSAPDQDIQFSKLEMLGEEGLIVVATALLKLVGPPTQEFPESEQFALLTMRTDSIKGRSAWWIDEVRFPYTPSSYVPQPKHDEHGHGHAH